jgi:PleD family two-component response regulator
MAFVLVIDDNRQTAEALGSMLKLWGLTSRQALTPSSAMGILGNETPCLVCLDINMPGVDGFEVLGYLKREPRLMNIPVVVITSDDQPETRFRALQIGAIELIVKPVMPDTLEEVIKKAQII